jgi:hypothetical protein
MQSDEASPPSQATPDAPAAAEPDESTNEQQTNTEQKAT